MNIGELFIRVTGDTSDVERKMRSARSAVDDFGNSTNRVAQAQEGHKLSLGKVERALASYIGHAAGANAVTEQLSVAFSSFAVGGEAVAGVLLGIGAVVGIYELLTAGSRKAREESDKLTKSLVDQAAAAHQATLAGANELALLADLNLQAVRRESSVGLGTIVKGAITGDFSVTDKNADDHAKRVADAETAVTQAYANVGKIALDTAAKTNVLSGATKELTSKFNELRDAAAKVNAQIQSEGKDFWRSYIESTKAAMSITDQLAERMRSRLPSLLDALEALSQVGQSIPTFAMPKISLDDGLTKEQINTRDKLIGNADKNKDAMVQAIMSSAQIIASALNIGGGGKNSGLGGALGGTAGFAIGFSMGGPIGGAIGSTLGSIAGSALGGLFDHNKKAVDSNTSAVKALTAAMIQNAPAGFNATIYRNREQAPVTVTINTSADAKEIARVVRNYATRGGAPLLATT